MSHPHDAFTRALQRLVDTLNSRGVAEKVDRAFAGDAVLERFDPGESDGDSEKISGSHAIARWMSKVPVTTRFALAGKCHVVDGREPAAAKVRYRYEWNGFLHGGTWVVQLANDGRLAHWAHHPDMLSEAKNRADAPPRHDEQPTAAEEQRADHHGHGGGGRRRRRRGGRGHG
jgi:hypothetical protein